ncbi:MAG: hypothetical protein ACRDID_18705 [Ktedonobacterales bacterium]
MTEKARRQDGEEKRDERKYLRTELSHELASECDLPETPLDAMDTTDTTEEIDPVVASEAEQAAGATERARTRRVPRKTIVAETSTTETPVTAAAEAPEVAALSAIEADRIELQAQGFSPEEAERLIEVTKRLETSAEALASQAELKRLRFAQWLFERGRLDEFSV